MTNPFWEQYNGFSVEGASPPPDVCAYALQFQQWADSLCTQVAAVAAGDNSEGSIAVNMAYVQLIRKYFSWRQACPKSHRNRVTDSGHTCIFHIFEAAFYQLRTLDLSLTPPLLFLTTSTPQAQPPQLPAPVYEIAGLALAEKEDEL